MADGNVQIHPAVQRMALRRQMAAALDRLLDVVDLLVRELDADAPDPDLEPSLGAPEHPIHLREVPREYDAAFAFTRGSQDDREADDDNWNGRDADFEPSLGSSPGINQRLWVNSRAGDLECEHDGREPSLGSIAVERWSNQRRWAAGGDQGEREDVCEDEGAFRDGDDEPDRDGEGTANPTWQVAGRLMMEVDGPDAWRPIDPDSDLDGHVERCEIGLAR